jgi:hypothetical protein
MGVLIRIAGTRGPADYRRRPWWNETKRNDAVTDRGAAEVNMKLLSEFLLQIDS